ncbi:hypothetical protein [Oceanirhabdus sp. W0125-5]|uniref:hypothetical protein n=1 Tax=Oceanirhabdus sp. W0125-5 TaxID=2999116 RepID=UPI0022F2FA9E|nr:hypothetical protein [Oceanirhabdus sp. W0125-5]WBW95523.1 hypothetical protein OW730_17740 [Oceanirhabdus sp. W0125-5]
MRERKEALVYSFINLKNRGAEKVQGIIERKQKFEFNVFQGEISLLRTKEDITLDLRAIKDSKQGTLKINSLDKKCINDTCTEIIALCESGVKDESIDIAPYQNKQAVIYGDEKPNLDKMYGLFEEFLSLVTKKYPYLVLGECILQFDRVEELVMNTNGVELSSIKGLYEINICFNSKNNGKTSSHKYIGMSMKDLENGMFNFSKFERLLKQSEKETI